MLVVHRFDTPGTYTVTLTVTDANGSTNTTSTTVTVTAFDGTDLLRLERRRAATRTTAAPARPFKTLTYAFGKMANNQASRPDRLLLACGDTWTLGTRARPAQAEHPRLLRQRRPPDHRVHLARTPASAGTAARAAPPTTGATRRSSRTSTCATRQERFGAGSSTPTCAARPSATAPSRTASIIAIAAERGAGRRGVRRLVRPQARRLFVGQHGRPAPLDLHRQRLRQHVRPPDLPQQRLTLAARGLRLRRREHGAQQRRLQAERRRRRGGAALRGPRHAQRLRRRPQPRRSREARSRTTTSTTSASPTTTDSADRRPASWSPGSATSRCATASSTTTIRRAAARGDLAVEVERLREPREPLQQRLLLQHAARRVHGDRGLRPGDAQQRLPARHLRQHAAASSSSRARTRCCRWSTPTRTSSTGTARRSADMLASAWARGTANMSFDDVEGLEGQGPELDSSPNPIFTDPANLDFTLRSGFARDRRRASCSRRCRGQGRRLPSARRRARRRRLRALAVGRATTVDPAQPDAATSRS